MDSLGSLDGLIGLLRALTSPNGWTDDHIGVEWLERVYLPQTKPADESNARLIILDGHGSHATVCCLFI